MFHLLELFICLSFFLTKMFYCRARFLIDRTLVKNRRRASLRRVASLSDDDKKIKNNKKTKKKTFLGHTPSGSLFATTGSQRCHCRKKNRRIGNGAFFARGGHVALASSKMAPISLEASLPFGAPKSKKKEKEKKRERERDKSKKKRKRKKKKISAALKKWNGPQTSLAALFFYSLSPPFYLVVSFCSSFVLLLLPSTASIFHLIVRVVAAYWLATLYRVLPGFHQLNIATRNQPHLSLTVFHWVLLGFTGFSWVPLSYI